VTPPDDPSRSLRAVRLVAAVLVGATVATVAGWLVDAGWAICAGVIGAGLSWPAINRINTTGLDVSEVLRQAERETGFAAEDVVEDAATIPSRLPIGLNRTLAVVAVTLVAIAYRIAPDDFRGYVAHFWADFAGNATEERRVAPIGQVGLAARMLGLSAGKRLESWARAGATHPALHARTAVAPGGSAPAGIPGQGGECGPPGGSRGAASDQLDLLMSFAVDIVDYSSRTGPQKVQAQDRLVAVLRRTLGRLDLDLDALTRENGGDAMKVILPAGTQLHRALPGVLDGLCRELAIDNETHPDRIRLRFAAAVGMIGPAAIGFSGELVIETHRLLECRQLRDAVQDHPDVDVVALVSKILHHFVIEPGWARLPPGRLEPLDIQEKEYRAQAWLWIPSLPSH